MCIRHDYSTNINSNSFSLNNQILWQLLNALNLNPPSGRVCLKREYMHIRYHVSDYSHVLTTSPILWNRLKDACFAVHSRIYLHLLFCSSCFVSRDINGLLPLMSSWCRQSAASLAGVPMSTGSVSTFSRFMLHWSMRVYIHF